MKRCALLVLLVLVGCSSEPAQPSLDWLAAVRSAHLHADAASDPASAERAIAGLQLALEVPVPASVSTDHRRIVHQDLLFRIAELELDAGRARQAQLAAERGLDLGRAMDLFTANLLIARGRSLEAAGRDTAAAAVYYEALEINRELLRRTLGSPDAEAP
jgi:hypothetical protein